MTSTLHSSALVPCQIWRFSPLQLHQRQLIFWLVHSLQVSWGEQAQRCMHPDKNPMHVWSWYFNINTNSRLKQFSKFSMKNQVKRKSNVVILGNFFHKAEMFQCISKVNFLYIIWQIWLSWSIFCFEIRSTQKPHILYIWPKFPMIGKQFFPFFPYQTNKRKKCFC